MISREFIYEFSNFDDISARENDKKSRAEAFCTHFEGLWYKFEGISCRKVEAQNRRSRTNQPLGL